MNHDESKSKVSAHNLGQVGGKQDGATEACSLHVARSDSVADSQDGVKCEQLPMNYKEAGVDIAAGEALVKKIKHKVGATYGPRVKSGVGGFACLYQCADRLLAAGTDGVGSKVLLAQSLNQHSTIGIDLVAMCVNDILCVGARPLFFMDYLAVGKLELSIAEKIVEGITRGCHLSGAALIGGETAEMPDLYQPGKYDLAGFAVGEVAPEDVLDGNRIREGDTLIGLASSGFHSNGYTLIRKLMGKDETLARELLTPTTIYWKALRELLSGKLLHALAHITGGGWQNIARANPRFDYVIENDEHWRAAPECMQFLCKKSKLPREELYHTFNMGIGMVLATPAPEEVLQHLHAQDMPAYDLGTVKTGTGRVVLDF